MNIFFISQLFYKFGIKIPEGLLKEKIVGWCGNKSNERIIEYPQILAKLPLKKSRILDVGCRYSALPIQIASLGHRVYGIDLFPYYQKHPNFLFRRGDILNPPFKKSFFDIVTAISTIEHIGCHYYGDKKDEKGDIKAVESVYKLIKPGGWFMLTLPFGKAMDAGWYRVYDQKRIEKLLSKFRQVELKTFVLKEKYWQVASIKKAKDQDSSRKVRAIVFAKARR